MQRQLRWSLCVALAFGSGCSDARLIDGIGEGQTRIRVVPAAFVGDVPCVRGGGGLQHYVVEMQQLPLAGTPADAGPAIALSPPTPCERAVVFPALPGRAYAADILGFDVAAASVPNATPRWRATCGRGANAEANAENTAFEPTIAVGGATVPLRGCTTFSGPPGLVSRLEIDLQSALGDLRCGGGAGEVAYVEGVLESQVLRATCDQALVFEIPEPGRFHTVTLTGFDLPSDAGVEELDAGNPAPPLTPGDAGADGEAATDAGADAALEVDAAPDAGAAPDAMPPEPVGRARWQTQCRGRSEPGVTRTATCDPFAPLSL